MMREDVKLVSLDRTATFTVQLPERAVAALRMIGAFGSDALGQASVRAWNQRVALETIDDLLSIIEPHIET